jgi:hypothetical protein
VSTKEEIQKLIKELRQEQRTLLKTQGGRSEEYYSCEDYITMLKEDLKELRQKHQG